MFKSIVTNSENMAVSLLKLYEISKVFSQFYLQRIIEHGNTIFNIFHACTFLLKQKYHGN